jgi:hypothetical protein
MARIFTDTNQPSVVAVLTSDEIAQVQRQSQAVANAAQANAIAANQFVYVAAFDGTNNDKNNLGLSGSTLSTNVAVISDMVVGARATNENLGGAYFAGVGDHGTPFFSPVIPTGTVIEKAERAYTNFADQASAWLRDNPGGSVTTAITAFSRGYGSAAVFSQSLFERGLVAPDGLPRAGRDGDGQTLSAEVNGGRRRMEKTADGHEQLALEI